MEKQSYGFFNLYYSNGLWNLRRFNNRRLKMLHIVGCYNTAAMVFLTVKKSGLVAESGVPVSLICVISFITALIGLAVEMPALAPYFEKLGVLLEKLKRPGRPPIRSVDFQPMGHELPIHHAGITFYFLLMALWLLFLLSII